jgi:hypothetical protein
MFRVYGGCKEGSHCVITECGRHEVDSKNVSLIFFVYFSVPLRRFLRHFSLWMKINSAGIDFLDESLTVSKHFFILKCMNNFERKLPHLFLSGY